MTAAPSKPSNKDYWVSYPDTPGGTAIRREFAELICATEKYVVSNTIAPQDLAPWQDTTRILRGADLYAEIAALKARPGRPILIQLIGHVPGHDPVIGRRGADRQKRLTGGASERMSIWPGAHS
jgi:hypothetical protein